MKKSGVNYFLPGLVSITFFVGGCASVGKLPTKAELAAADYGLAPENPKEQAMAYFESHLNAGSSDLSVWFEGECAKGWWRMPEDSAHATIIFGWKLQVKASVRDMGGRFGDYKPDIFYFRDKNLVFVSGNFSR